MQINTLHFSPNNMLAVGVSARVDLYTLKQPESQDEIDFDELKPSQQIFKFEEVVSALQFRQDGQIMVVGEGSGKIQLIEVKNKYILRSYDMGKNRVNALTFSDDNRHFASCANDTCLRYFDIQDSTNKCAIEIPAAHSDNIKQVKLLS